jgi:hypothetical protein
MHSDPMPMLRTLERKQAYVLGVDDASFVAEAHGFLRWAFGDRTLRPHLAGMLIPPREVARFVEVAPRLISEAGDVVNWLRAKEPAICAHVASERDWGMFDTIVAMAREQSSPEAADRADFVFNLLRMAREGVGLSFGDRVDEEIVAAWRAAADLATAYEHHARERDLAVRISPGGALMQLVTLCRGGDAVPDGLPHWSDFARGAVGFGRVALDDMATARGAFRRFVEGLLSSLEGSLPGQRMLQRFKERAVWFDRERLRATADDKAEAALTLELGRYLHDAGLPVMPIAHPTAVAQLPLPEKVIGARAVVSTGADRRHVLRGLHALHAQLLSLDAAAFEVEEGLLAIFCLEGPLFELPPTIRTERFTIHIETIDLASERSITGAKPVRIDLDEAIRATQ